MQYLCLPALLLFSTLVRAVVPDTAAMASIAAQFKGDDAIFTNYTERLVIGYENGNLTATSYISEDKLINSDVAASNSNWNYAPHSFYHQISDIHGMAYIPNASGYKTSRDVDYSVVRSSESVFYDDNVITVQTFPGATKGSVLHTTYTVDHTDMHIMPLFRFQSYIPIKKAVFEVEAPDFVKINFVLKGENTDRIKQTKDTKNGNIIYTFTTENMSASKEPVGVPSTNYYIPHVLPVIVSYTLPGDDKPTEVSSTIKKLYDFNKKFIKNLNVTEDTTINKIVKKLTKGKTTDLEKASAIYRWVQDEIHYIAFEQGLEGFKPREASVVCERKYGDCKDMTSILVAMFRNAGLTATYTWIGTTALPYTYEETPIPHADNHMICAVKINGEWKFADATHPGLPFGECRDDIQGKEALIAIDENNYKVVTIPIAPASANAVSDITNIKFYETEIYGDLHILDTGYDAWNMSAALISYKNIAHRDEKLKKIVNKLTERGSDKYDMKKYDYVSFLDNPKALMLYAEFSVRDYVKKYKKQYFINMNLTHEFADTYIDTAGRTTPYYIDFKKHINDIVYLEIPDTMKVDYIPKSHSGSIPGVMSYRIDYIREDGRIALVKHFEIETLEITPNHFRFYNDMIDELNKCYKESVVVEPQKIKKSKTDRKIVRK